MLKRQKNLLAKSRMSKTSLEKAKAEAEAKAYDALARYKFLMFGYWAAIWVHLNSLAPSKGPNPFRSLVHRAREVIKFVRVMEERK